MESKFKIGDKVKDIKISDDNMRIMTGTTQGTIIGVRNYPKSFWYEVRFGDKPVLLYREDELMKC